MDLTCEGIHERIQLLQELIKIKPVEVLPDVYDEMEHIVEAMTRNDKF